MSELSPEDWVERYGNDLYRFALARLRHPRDAENAVSETFLAAMTAQSSFSGKSSERTWLIGILRHKIVDHMRKNYREKPVTDLQENEAAIDQFFDQKQQLKKIPSGWLPDPAELLKKQEFWKAFHECTKKLPLAARDAFILREIDCLDSRQICETLNITPSHLWVMLYRARLQLRQCLEINWFERPN